ncbi:hypothetical protein OCA08_21680 [Bacillus cereus]|nr:hypothetical protein [Bacillus cereus]
MKKKLGVLSAVCILSTSLFVGSASAAEVGNPDNLPAEGTVIPQKIDSTVDSYASDYPVYRYKTRHNSGTVKTTSESMMSNGKFTPIKRIYAKARAYKDGALVKQSTDNQYNASYAGADAKAGNSGWDVEGFGNHIFEKTGYITISYESYSK